VLHDHFGRGDDLMRQLRAIRNDAAVALEVAA
jgi:hypothetical protein